MATVAVVGLGTMGAGIAEVFARAGLTVTAVEADADALSRGMAILDGSLGKALETRSDTFETLCGSWAGFKLARYLMLFTGEARYGDWIERLFYNGAGAALPRSGLRLNLLPGYRTTRRCYDKHQNGTGQENFGTRFEKTEIAWRAGRVRSAPKTRIPRLG